jgi:class 3 adenylate cyclase
MFGKSKVDFLVSQYNSFLLLGCSLLFPVLVHFVFTEGLESIDKLVHLSPFIMCQVQSFCNIIELKTVTNFMILISFGSSHILCFQIKPLSHSVQQNDLVLFLHFAVCFAFINFEIPVIYPLVSSLLVFIYFFMYTCFMGRLIQKYTNPQIDLKLFNSNLFLPVEKQLMQNATSQKKELSLLFCDIRQFTLFTNSNSPEKTKQLLLQYYVEMYALIEKQHAGKINKFIGDSVLAYWGGEQESLDHALNAVKTALAIRKVVQRWKNDPEKISIDVGIGVNTGEVFLGQIGPPDAGDFTVVGAAVNTAAKLERLNKIYNTSIIISGETYLKVQNSITARYLGAIVLQGQSKGILLYEPLTLLSEFSAYSAVKFSQTCVDAVAYRH